MNITTMIRRVLHLMTSGFYGSVFFLFLHGGYIGVCFVIINLSLTYLLLFSVLGCVS